MAKGKNEVTELKFSDRQELFRAILDNEEALEAAKEAYKTRDLLIAAYMKSIGDDGEDHAFDGRTITLVDNFAEKNCMFKPASFRRYDLKVEEAD